MDLVIHSLESVLFVISKLMIVVLELIGVIFIVYGSIKALIRLAKVKLDFRDFEFKFLLAESLSTALQFKLGAEVLKTVVINDFSELIVVGLVVVLRLIITFAIHWEMKQEANVE